MEANKFITNETDNMLTQMNNKRIMTDDELKQIFGKDKNFTYADFECLIDSKVNVQDVYTKKYLQEIMEAYYGSSPEIAKDWYDKELERRANEEKRKSDELIRQSQEQNRVLSWNQMKSDVDETIQDIGNRMDSIENQFDSMVDGTGFATQEFVNENISSLVDSAPETLNTLGKLANALNNNPDFSTDTLAKVEEKASIKYVKENLKNKSDINHTHSYNDLDDLPTSEELATKEDLKLINRDIENLKLSVSSGKKEVASAITDKGIPTLATDTFKTMSDNIKKIVSYSDLSIKISVQMEEPLEPKDGDLWLVTDITPGRIVLSYDESKAIKEEGLVFIKLKFLDIVCNFNEQISSLLEIPNQVIIDFDKGDKRLDIRGVGIANGGVIDLYADFSHAKIFKDSKFEYLQFKYYHNGQWVTLDNGFDYMYIIRNGNIALFNPMSKSVIWEKTVGIREYPQFGIDADDKLLISGDTSNCLLSRLDKQGNTIRGEYYDYDAFSAEYLSVIGNSDGTTLLSYPQDTNYTTHVKLSESDEIIWKVSHQDRILCHFDTRYAFHFLSGIVMDSVGGFAVIYYNQNRGDLKEGNICARFFDNKGKQTGYSSNFFTLKADHYISKVKQNKKGEIFALATAKKDTSPVSKAILYKYNTYEDFKNRKTSNNIAFTNTFYINDFVVVDSSKIVFMQYISSTSVKVTEIDTATMTKIKDVSVNISDKTYTYSCDREGNIITNAQSILLDGTVSPLSELSQITDSSPNTNKYRCINTVIEKYFE